MMRHLAVILVLGLILAGCTGKGNAPSSGTSGNANLDSCLADCHTGDSNFQQTCRESCYDDAGTSSGDISYCDKMLPLRPNLTVMYDHCVMGVAEPKNDASLCEKLAPSATRTDETAKDTCIIDIVKKTGDHTPCSSITDPNWKTACTNQ